MNTINKLANKLVSPPVMTVLVIVGICWCAYASASYTVVYKVTGSNEGLVYVSISNPYLDRTVTVDHLPWKLKVTAWPGDYLNLDAAFVSPGSVTCEIWVDGKLERTNTESHINEIYGFGSCGCDIELH